MTVTDTPDAAPAPAPSFRPVVDMVDATAANCRHIPLSVKKVAGYITGPGIMWAPEDWDLFSHTSTVRIEQDAAAEWPTGSGPRAAVYVPVPDVYDVETGAGTPAKAAAWVARRVAAGHRWSTLYGTDATLAQCRFELAKFPPPSLMTAGEWYFGHVDCWLADWNLDRAAAAALIGSEIHGLTCRAVQWASPVTNPGTPIPGSPLTLAQALVDLSVADEAWPIRELFTTTPPPKPPAAVRYGFALEWRAPDQAPGVKLLTSVDGGPWA